MSVCLSICSQFLSETVDQRLFAIFENFYHQISLEIILNVNGVVIVISLGTPYQAKISFVIYGSKCSRSMKQQDCKICYEQLWNKIDFLHADKRQSLFTNYTTLFDRRDETCTDGQPKCKITRRAISHKAYGELL